MTMSMTETHHSAENALAERVNGILKQEYDLDSEFADPREAKQATHRAIGLYNTRRPHSALGYATPEQRHIGGGR
jgi:putative transposase